MIPLGVHVALGRLTESSYRNHVNAIVEAWGMCTLDDPELLERGKHATLGSSTSDMGPGLFQVFTSLKERKLASIPTLEVFSMASSTLSRPPTI